jgi:FtsZ-binding cell division protein ZapB
MIRKSRGRLLSDSDVESQVAAEQESNGLQSRNDALRCENSILRAQLDHAVALAQRIEELHEKNAKLTTARTGEAGT